MGGLGLLLQIFYGSLFSKAEFFGLGNLSICIRYVVSTNPLYLAFFFLCNVLLFGTPGALSTPR